MHKKRRKKNCRRAAAVVEFAVTAPLLFLLIVVSVEFTRLSILRHNADNAAYEAARHVIVPGATEQEAKDVAEALLSAVGVQVSTVTVDPTPIEESTASVTVTVEVPMIGNAWFQPFFSDGTRIVATSTLLTERVPAVLASGIPEPPAPPPPPSPGDDDDDDGGGSPPPSLGVVGTAQD